MQTTDNRLPQVIDTVKRAVSIIGLLILFASCAGPTGSLQYREFNEHLERWRAHGITNYRMRVQSNCHCDSEYWRPKIVDVRDGLVHSAWYEDDGTSAPADTVQSIDSLLSILKKGVMGERGHNLVGVYYNAEYGYPGVVAFDTEGMTDAYFDYHVKLLMIMEEDAGVRVLGAEYNAPLEIARTMVSIPGGTFRMGDLSGEEYDNGLPVHTVTVPSFRLGRYEVTFDQWEACLADGGCNGYRPHDWALGGNRPIAGSWSDARSFIDWLNRKIGGNYRLPTEAEWEYAARAGSDAKFSWGNDVGNNRANCDSCGSQWDGGLAAPVGSSPANAWGLHDMHGNVSEWVQDCWNDSYEGAPTDGSAWESGDCSQRVVRGGNWLKSPWYMRSAHRDATFGSYQGYYGFRLARDE